MSEKNKIFWNKEQIIQHLPIGSKIIYEENECIYLGVSANNNPYFAKLRTNENVHFSIDYMWSNNETVEVLEFAYYNEAIDLPKYKKGDMIKVIHDNTIDNEEKEATYLIVLSERDSNLNYLCFSELYQKNNLRTEEEIEALHERYLDSLKTEEEVEVGEEEVELELFKIESLENTNEE